jgi:transposase-like protein
MKAKDKKFKSILELTKVFPDERSAHEYLAAQRWSDGVIECPHCEHDRAYVFKDGIRYKCCKCKKKFTAKTGTIMEASNLPSIKWIFAIYLVTHKKGISSVQLAKDLSVTQRTAWFLLHRIRTAFGNEPDKKELLDGTIELDETFVGGKNKNRHYSKRVKYREETGRTYPDKTPVFGMYCRETKSIRAFVLSKTQLKHINRAITYNINFSATLMTDDWIGYRGIDAIYKRHYIEHSKWTYVDGDITTNRIENFWSHLKRGLHGTYIHVTPKHLNKYVQEFVFRFNYRNLDASEQFECVVKNMRCRLKYKDLIAA